MKAELREALLSLWDKAVGHPSYSKEEWINFEKEINKNTMTWISVKERLPEGADYVLVWTGVYEIAQHHQDREGYQWWDLMENEKEIYPSHWMPLPSPPEEK